MPKPRYKAVALPMQNAADVNDLGAVVGTDQTDDSPDHQRLLLWKNGKLRVLAKSPYFKGTDNQTHQLNPDTIENDNRITGYYTDVADGAILVTTPFPFVWEKGRLSVPVQSANRPSARIDTRYDNKNWRIRNEDIGEPLSKAEQNAVQESPDGAAQFHTLAGLRHCHAVLFDARKKKHDLGVLPGEKWSYATSVNENGQVIGASGERLFLWKNRAMTELPPLVGAKSSPFPNIAGSINRIGNVVGRASGRAVLWQNHRAFDLNAVCKLPTGFVLIEAVKITDRGQILANGENTKTGKEQAFLLTPAKP